MTAESTPKNPQAEPTEPGDAPGGELVSGDAQDEESGQTTSIVATHYSFSSGPIPDPETLRKYEEIHPGAIEWILNASDDERKHRHDMDRTKTSGFFAERRLGQILAFGCVVCFVSLAAYLVRQGYGWPASLLGVSGLGTIVYMFIKGRSESREGQESREDKEESD